MLGERLIMHEHAVISVIQDLGLTLRQNSCDQCMLTVHREDYPLQDVLHVSVGHQDRLDCIGETDLADVAPEPEQRLTVGDFKFSHNEVIDLEGLRR